MTLAVERHASLEAVGRAAWLALENGAPDATVFQSWWWLSAWWPVWGEGTPHVVAVHEHGRLVGAGAFYTAPDGTLRFIGEEHADYGGVLAERGREDVVEAIVAALFAAPIRWRRLCLHDVPLDGRLASALRARGAIEGGPVPCPRVRFDARPLEALLDKDSLKRHERKLRRQGEVTFLHLDAAAEIEPWLPRFVSQHVERWALTPTPSLFREPRNVEFYSALTGSAEPGGSLLFTVVLLDAAPAAMHFGLRSGDDLVWYKPTFDPRLAASGPGEVLLAELLRRAGREGAGGVDFTRGDEAFKLRFASEVRHVALIEAWPTPAAAATVRRRRALKSAVKAGLVRVGLKERVATLARRAGRAAHHFRHEGVGGLVRRTGHALAEPRARTLEVYVRSPAVPPSAATGAVLSEVVRCASLAALFEVIDPAADEHAELLRHARDRFASGDTLIAGLVDDELVVHGWQTVRSPLPVTELEAELHFPDDAVLLYDFRVVEAARGQGYYAALLRVLSASATAAHVVIYALTDNVASRRGIEAAGFCRIGTLTADGGEPRYVAVEAAAGPRLTLVPRGAAVEAAGPPAPMVD